MLGVQQVTSQRGVWPSSEVFTTRCPPGDAGFLLVVAAGWGSSWTFKPHMLRGATRKAQQALQENPRGPHSRGQSRASACPSASWPVTTSEPRVGTPRFLWGVLPREEEQWRAVW